MATLAVSTYSFGPSADLLQVVRTGEENGFGGLELGSFTYWPSALSEHDESLLREAVSRNGWALSVHFIHRGVSLGNHEEETRLALVHQLQETVRLCARLGGSLVVVHAGNLTRSNEGDIGAAREEAVRLLIDSLGRCIPTAEEQGVYLGLENTHLRPVEILSSYEDYVRVVKEVGSEYLAFTLDLGHANMSAGIQRAFEVMGPWVRHLHLHDNHGAADDHLEAGKGSIDFRAYRGYLSEFPGMAALESRDPDDPEGAVVRSRAYLRETAGV